jgi:predicted GTPase
MSTEELLERIANSLETISSTLERIEIVLEEKQNKTQESKEARELMQAICKYYKETEPRINIQVGTRLQLFRFRDAISKIKNIRNAKLETRKLTKWLRKLEDHEFVSRTNNDMFEVLDTGADWWGNQE